MRVDRNLTFEGPERDLHLLQSLDGGQARCPPDAPQPQLRAFDVHLQVLAPNAGHLESDDDLLRRLEDIRRRLPAISAQPIGKLAEELDERMAPTALRNRPSPR